MRIRDIMTTRVHTITPSTTLRDAAQLMAEIDAGVLPVTEDDRLVGMLTDRDIAIRGVACGKGPETPAQDVLTREVMYCFDEDEVEDVCENMSAIQVRRLPVVNGDKRLVGIVSLADLAQIDPNAGAALEGITRPGGLHSQSMDGDGRVSQT